MRLEDAELIDPEGAGDGACAITAKSGLVETAQFGRRDGVLGEPWRASLGGCLQRLPCLGAVAVGEVPLPEIEAGFGEFVGRTGGRNR